MEADDCLLMGWRGRPYVTAVVGSACDDAGRWTEWENGRVWVAEAFATDSAWAFSTSEPSHVLACDSAVRDSVEVVRANRYTEDEDLAPGDIAAIEALAVWCVGRVLTYPVRVNAGGPIQIIASSLDYAWEVWECLIGERRAVMGLAFPLLSQSLLLRDEVRLNAAVWVRHTFGPAFFSAGIGGWSCVARGTADKSRVGWGWGQSEKGWSAGPRTWSAWA